MKDHIRTFLKNANFSEADLGEDGQKILERYDELRELAKKYPTRQDYQENVKRGIEKATISMKNLTSKITEKHKM